MSAVLLVAGALLLTPGFFTDTIGFLCLVPSFRRVMIRWALGRFLMPPGGFGGPGNGPNDSAPGGPHRPRTIEGEYRREDD